MKIKSIMITLVLSASLFFSQVTTIFAITETEVEAYGKENTAGNIFIWFLCAIAFLKISQKIDSFMSSLGINVGHTGGSMMAELMIAARGLTTAKNISTGGSFRGGTHSSHMSNASFMNGGLAGAVGRQFTQSALNSVTGQGGNPITQRMFESSMQRGGRFANDVTSAVAKGNLSHTGSMKGLQAAQALSSYMGQTGQPSAPVYSNVEIGGGRISGMETSTDHPDGIAFGMYQTDQYMTPDGNYETITAEDHSTWYKQYAADFVERTPYMTEKGKIAYKEELVQKMPEMPRRKERG